MKKLNSLYLLTLIILLGSCKKHELQLYNEKPAVYFSNFSTADSLVHSLAGASGNSSTIYLNVKLLGKAFEADKRFKIEVDPSYTDAKEGLHFVKLADSYVFPAKLYTVSIPIVLLKSDPVLGNSSVKLGLKLVPTDDLDIAYSNRLLARVQFTNALVMPSYWDTYLNLYYGVYSKVKHQKCIEIQGFDFPAARTGVNSQLQTKLMSYGRIVCKYFTDNIVNDENGNRIMPWAPL